MVYIVLFQAIVICFLCWIVVKQSRLVEDFSQLNKELLTSLHETSQSLDDTTKSLLESNILLQKYNYHVGRFSELLDKVLNPPAKRMIEKEYRNEETGSQEKEKTDS